MQRREGLISTPAGMVCLPAPSKQPPPAAQAGFDLLYGTAVGQFGVRNWVWSVSSGESPRGRSHGRPRTWDLRIWTLVLIPSPSSRIGCGPAKNTAHLGIGCCDWLAGRSWNRLRLVRLHEALQSIWLIQTWS